MAGEGPPHSQILWLYPVMAEGAGELSGASFGCPLAQLCPTLFNPVDCIAQRNPMDRETWWATVHGVTKSQT